MAAWRYEIFLLVLKKYFTRSLLSLMKYFLTLEEKCRISRSHVISSIYHAVNEIKCLLGLQIYYNIRCCLSKCLLAVLAMFLGNIPRETSKIFHDSSAILS